MNNKKGFTLAELLGTIVVLLLLILIIIPIFAGYSKNAGDTAYDAQINSIKQSAKEWALDDDNAKLLPTKENECVEVTLEKLKEEGLLDYNIKNPKTDEPFDDDLTVIIKKEGKELTYTFNEDGAETCDTVITASYPKWVYVSSTPASASDTDEVTVNIKSDVKISEYNLTADKIVAKVGGTIADDAGISVTCNNGSVLSCSVVLTNLSGTGRLSLVIDKETMKDEDLNPSRITNIGTDTVVDTEGPKLTYIGRENTNASIYYATKADTVTIKFKAEDNGNITDNLAADDIEVYLDGTLVTCTKELVKTGSGKKIEYALKLTNVEGNGKVSIKIPSGKVLDNKGNANNEKIIAPGITFDNIPPVITFNPNETTGYVQKLKATINVVDNETGVDEDTIKYIFTTNTNDTPNVAISNGGLIEKKDLSGDYYLIGYACDYAGNCTNNSDAISGIYHMNNSGPILEITPDHNTGYSKTATVNIKATSRGEALDEGSLKYTISTDINAPVNTMYTNNSNVSISDLTGEYYVIAEACDTLGNCTRETSDKFYFDNQTPTVQYNPDGKGWSKSVSVGITVTDNVELNWSKYIVSTSNTATPNVTINNGSATATVTSTNTTGTYYVITKGCDRLNNCRTIVSQPYSIDNTKPTIVSVGVSGRTTTIRATDDVQLAYFEVYNSSGTKLNTTNFDCTNKKDCTKTYDNNVGGTYTLKVYDHLGNMSQTTFTIPTYTVTFAVNNTAMGSVANAQKVVNYGEKAETTFSINTGYIYSSVTSGCTVSGNKVSVASVTGNKTCTVTLAAKKITVTFKPNGGTGSDQTQTFTYGVANQKFTAKGFTRNGYNQGKWAESATGTGQYDILSGVADSWINSKYDANSTHTVTLYATWTAACSYSAGTSWDYSYNGSYHEFTVPCNGVYKIEVWGAQGGDWFGAINMGGLGGHMAGNVTLTKNSKLYIVVGGSGKTHNGYNGGGEPGVAIDGYSAAYRGGGASHIATAKRGDGKLTNYASYQSEVLIVAGGGGGGAMSGSKPGIGGGGGGTNGANGEEAHNCWNNEGGSGCAYSGGTPGTGGTQSAAGHAADGNYCAGSFGQGGNAWTSAGGGGGGWYGGGGGSGGGSSYADGGNAASGGGGSGHFGTGVTAVTNETGVWGSDAIADGKAKITLVSISS